MVENDKEKIIGELKDFYKKLRRYENRQRRRDKDGFAEAQDKRLNAFRLELQREYGRLKESISEYGSTPYISRPGERHESFLYILGSLDIKSGTFIALDGAINAVNEAIGNLEKLEEAKPELPTKKGEKSSWQKIWHLLDHLWQVTIKAAFEGIINGIKRP